MAALPFAGQPPPGEGTTTPEACAAPVPLTVIVTVRAGLWPSVTVTAYCPVKVPLLCGVKVTGTVMESSGLMPRPIATGTGVPNGTRGPVKPVTVSGRLPALVKVTSALTDLPSATAAKPTEVRDAVSAPAPATLIPDSGTDTAVPSESVTVKEPPAVEVTWVGL